MIVEKFLNFFLPEQTVVAMFWWCVGILKDICAYTGMTYEALNIWVFVIIQPALILIFALLWLRQRAISKQLAQ